jgi:hypothetical protein
MIEVTAFDKTARTITIKTEKGHSVSISGLDPQMDDAKLKEYLSSISAQKDRETLDPEAPLAKVALKATDKFDSAIVAEAKVEVIE